MEDKKQSRSFPAKWHSYAKFFWVDHLVGDGRFGGVSLFFNASHKRATASSGVA